MRKYLLKENGADQPDIFRDFSDEERENLKSAARLIADGFDWASSAEGYEFWSDVVARLRDISEMEAPKPAGSGGNRPLKPGDRVVCVEMKDDSSGLLKLGRIYTIKRLIRLSDGRPGVMVQENGACWVATRFRHADQALPAMWLGADAFPEEKVA